MASVSELMSLLLPNTIPCTRLQASAQQGESHTDRYQVSPLAALLQAFAYSVASTGPAYPVFAGIFFFNGMGFGLQVGATFDLGTEASLSISHLPKHPPLRPLLWSSKHPQQVY
jgi:hypothetical protein